MTGGQVVIPPGAGEEIPLGRGLGVICKIPGEATRGAFAVVEHHLPPATLAAPLHTHSHEDELSYVLEGEVGVQIGETVYQAATGSYLLKPRGVPHTFCNAGAQPARLQTVITPGGFERYFRELAALLAAEPHTFEGIWALADRYGLRVDWRHLPEFMERHGVRLR